VSQNKLNNEQKRIIEEETMALIWLWYQEKEEWRYWDGETLLYAVIFSCICLCFFRADIFQS